MSIKSAILTLKEVTGDEGLAIKQDAAARRARAARQRREDWSDIDPSDIDPDTGAPYEDYSSPCIEPHPFGGGILAGDY